MSYQVIGTGSCLPDAVLTNADLSRMVDTSDEWITSRTGIKERHVLKKETLLDIAVAASRAALERAATMPEELSMIICGTVQGDYIMPSLACQVAEVLGIHCAAFDLNAACTGFLYALDLAKSCFDAGRANRILIICAEHLTKFIDWQDRTTCVLFGDGAGAVVLAPGEGVLTVSLRSKARGDCLYIPAQAPSGPFEREKEQPRKSHFVMNGQEVYRFAVSTVAEDAEQAVREAGIRLDDVDYFVLHQANQRIIETVRTRLMQPESKFPQNVAARGNTSSASIPMLLDEMCRDGKLKSGDMVLMSAFGAGLTSGVCLMKWGQ